MLKLSDWEFKITIINLLGALTYRVDSMQEQMGNVTREMEILKKSKKEMLGIKTTVTEKKNAYNGPDRADGKKHLSYNTYKQNPEKKPKAENADLKQTNKQTNKTTTHRISKDCGITAKGITYA